MADLGSLSEVPKPARPQNFFCYLTSLEPKEPDKTFRFDSRGRGSTFKGVPPADENGDIGTSDRVGQDESVGTN